MNPKTRGYTLVEMLLVTIIIGVIAMVSIIAGRSVIQRTSFTNAVNMLIADISSIKQSAAKENRYFAIRFNADGASYKIQRQTTIGNLDNWTDISTMLPLEGKECFNKAIVTSAWQGFAINPMGIVYTLPIAAGAAPASQNFYLYVKHLNKTDYNKNVLIYANGGIKIGK
jgi:prepilin-type N-terminal cleavage/methylation domain-containing protein